MIELQQTIDAAKDIGSRVQEILPPVIVLERCRSLAKFDNRIRRHEIGHTERGIAIEAYEFGDGLFHSLLYAFPDPGEAVGGTTSLSLLSALSADHEFLSSLGVGWRLIPCLNFDDQPHEGKTLANVFRSPGGRDVDWCLNNPRSETTALLNYADAVRPQFCFPLHDEYHCGDPIPVYLGVTKCLSSGLCRCIREVIKAFGLTLSEKYGHEGMGKGFFIMSERVGAGYARSTFSRLEKHGLVFVSEVSQREDLLPRDLVSAQLALGLTALQFALKMKD